MGRHMNPNLEKAMKMADKGTEFSKAFEKCGGEAKCGSWGNAQRQYKACCAEKDAADAASAAARGKKRARADDGAEASHAPAAPAAARGKQSSAGKQPSAAKQRQQQNKTSVTQQIVTRKTPRHAGFANYWVEWTDGQSEAVELRLDSYVSRCEGAEVGAWCLLAVRGGRGGRGRPMGRPQNKSKVPTKAQVWDMSAEEREKLMEMLQAAKDEEEGEEMDERLIVRRVYVGACTILVAVAACRMALVGVGRTAMKARVGDVFVRFRSSRSMLLDRAREQRPPAPHGRARRMALAPARVHPSRASC